MLTHDQAIFARPPGRGRSDHLRRMPLSSLGSRSAHLPAGAVRLEPLPRAPVRGMLVLSPHSHAYPLPSSPGVFIRERGSGGVSGEVCERGCGSGGSGPVGPPAQGPAQGATRTAPLRGE